MIVRPEWIEVNDIIYIDGVSPVRHLQNMYVVTQIDKDEWGGINKIFLSDKKEGGLTEEIMYFHNNNWWLQHHRRDDGLVKISLYKGIGMDWVRNFKISLWLES